MGARTAGTIKFDSTRKFTGLILGDTTVSRTADGDWKGTIYSATGGLAYEFRTGRLTLRPNASVEYYKLNERGYYGNGRWRGFDLTVRSRTARKRPPTRFSRSATT